MADAESKIQNPKSKIRLAEIALLLITAAFLLWSRALNFSAPLDPDEANYGFIGSRLIAGDRMYVDVWDQQPPLTFLIFGELKQLFGPAESTFRGFAAACSVVTLACLYFTVRRGFGLWPAVAVALLWALVSHDPGTDGDQANREIYMNTCAVAALLCLSRVIEIEHQDTQTQIDAANVVSNRAGQRRRWALILLAGLFIALGTVFKIILALLWFAALPWLVWTVARRRSEPRAEASGPPPSDAPIAPAPRRAIPQSTIQNPKFKIAAAALLFAAGPLLIWSAHALYFAADGRFQLFFDAVIRHNFGYASGDVRSAGPGWNAFFTAEPWVFVPTLPLWIAGAIGFVIGPWRNATANLVRVYALATLLEIILPGKFWRHYYHLLLPPLVLLAGMGIATLLGTAHTRIQNPKSKIQNRALLALLGLAALTFPLIQRQHFWYYSRSAEERSFLRYVIMALWPRHIGQAAGRHSKPDDALYVHGDAVGVYFYAERRPLTKYTMASQFLLAEYAGAAERQREVAVAFEQQAARFIFLMAPPFPELTARLEREYRLICESGPLVVFAHRSVPSAEIPEPETWIWEPSDPDMIARCQALNEQYKIWHPPPTE